MFATVSAEIGSRLLASERLLAGVALIEKESPESSAIFKGLCFVELYAVYEYAVRASVQAALSVLKTTGLKIRQIRPEVLCLALEAHWSAARQAGQARVWDCRIELMNEINSDAPSSEISDTLFPADGSHYRVKQLYTIWKVFGVTDPIVPEARFLGRIDEMVENRNAIAHGRRTPGDVGRSYSYSEIQARFADLKCICDHIVKTLEIHTNADGLIARAAEA